MCMCVSVQMRICALCGCDQLRYCMYFSHHGIWCFCSNHSFTDPHFRIDELIAFSSECYLPMIHLSLTWNNSICFTRIYKSCSHRIRVQTHSSPCLNPHRQSPSDCRFFSLVRRHRYSIRCVFLQMQVQYTWTNRNESNVIDYEMVNFMACFTHTSQTISTAQVNLIVPLLSHSHSYTIYKSYLAAMKFTINPMLHGSHFLLHFWEYVGVCTSGNAHSHFTFSRCKLLFYWKENFPLDSLLIRSYRD